MLFLSAFACLIPLLQEPAARAGGEYPDLTADGAWCWFADPRAVYQEGRTLAGWVNAKGDVQVGAFDPRAGEVELATIAVGLQVDDHANPALLVLPDGKLLVFYSAHNGREMFLRRSTGPGSIDEWEPRRAVGTNSEGRQGFTYPNPVQLADEGGRIYLFWRGGDWNPNVATSDDRGDTWSTARTWILNLDQRPYLKLDSNGADRIHLAFTDGHPRVQEQNSIHYAGYRAGALRRADGSPIAELAELPIAPQAAELVYDPEAHGARAWVWDVAGDAQQHPVIAYTALPAERDHRYRYARWDGGQWIDGEITAGGGWFPRTPEGQREREPHYSGGMALDHRDPSLVYLSVERDGVFEIERWRTPDGGRTWSGAPVTRGSTRGNVRPCVPRGHPGGEAGLLWMHGDYVHYTRYSTALKRAATPR